ncbi:MAG: VCBS repeat-containing protein [Planctomycetota bacterium]
MEASFGAALFDVDGDGDLDLVVANSGQNRLHVNDGHAHFVDVELPLDTDVTRGVAAGDLDGDGHPDLVWANDAAQNRLYRWTAAGYVDATARLPVRIDRTQAVALADVDGDGDSDILFGNFAESHRLYLNDGAGVFVDVTATHFGAVPNGYQTRAILFADVDADGDLDAWIASAETVELFDNDGSGHFTDVSDRLPAPRPGALGLACADLDGDGDLDLVCGTVRGQRTRAYANDGLGRFVDVTALRLPDDSDSETGAVLAGDFDGDGDLDLVLGNGSLSPVPVGARNALWRNDGSGVFERTEGARVSADSGVTGAAVAGDLDSDGDLDWVAIRGARLNVARVPLANQVHLNDGQGWFAVADETGLPVDIEVSLGAAVGDVDGDGELDLVFANQPALLTFVGGRNQLFLHDAEATRYVEATAAQFRSDPADTRAVALADVDGDSDLDLILADRNGCRLLINDGFARFVDATASRLPPSGLVMSIAVGDVDGDRDLDLFVGRDWGSGGDMLLINDGSGHFADVSASHLPQVENQSARVVLVDVDGDGDLDAVVADSFLIFHTNRVYTNDGGGRFTDETAVRLPEGGTRAWTVVAFDADGDGDVDLVFGDDAQDRLFVNDGSGFFRSVPGALPTDPTSTEALAAGDLDGDGDVDLVLGKSGASGSRVLENDGHGLFVDRTRAFWGDGPGAARWIEIADLDADGDQDVLVVRSGGGFGGETNLLYANRTRQISAPWAFVPGRVARLTFEAAPGRSNLFHLAIPLLAPRRARVPVPPFGELGLDPMQLVMLEPIYVPPLPGTATLSLAVPDNPALVGMTLYWQALLLHPLHPARFTNVIADAIRR